MFKNPTVLPPFPNGWFVIELSENLKKGQLISRQFSGEEVIIYRTDSGKAAVMGAHCPHMGANFAHGGKIVGEDVECPFHGFCFNTTGDCTKTGYGTPPPPKAKTRVWPVREQNGVILAFHHEDPSVIPDWHVTPLNEEGWSDIMFHEWELNSNPQEITENSVDFGHFGLVHGYGDLKIIDELKIDGPVLNAKYGMSRIANFIGKGGKKVHVEFEIHQYGLGYAHVDAHVLEYGLRSRHFVMPTAMDGTNIFLRIGVSVNKNIEAKKIHPLLGVIPKGILFPFIKKGYYKGYINDVFDDFKIWKNKIYVDPPMLAAGDGPVLVYRKWAAQFHPESWVEMKKAEEQVLQES